MTVREIINSLEAEKRQLKEENKNLKDENKKLYAEIESLKKELSKKEVVTEPVVEEVEPQITSIVTNVDGKISASIVEGSSISIDDVTEKPKRNRKKKVEPVEEPIENV